MLGECAYHGGVWGGIGHSTRIGKFRFMTFTDLQVYWKVHYYSVSNCLFRSSGFKQIFQLSGFGVKINLGYLAEIVTKPLGFHSVFAKIRKALGFLCIVDKGNSSGK